MNDEKRCEAVLRGRRGQTFATCTLAAGHDDRHTDGAGEVWGTSERTLAAVCTCPTGEKAGPNVPAPPPCQVHGVCSACGAGLLFSARQRGDGLCGPCSREKGDEKDPITMTEGPRERPGYQPPEPEVPPFQVSCDAAMHAYVGAVDVAGAPMAAGMRFGWQAGVKWLLSRMTGVEDDPMDHVKVGPAPVSGDVPERIWWCLDCNGGVGCWGLDEGRPPPRCPDCKGTKFAPVKFVHMPPEVAPVGVDEGCCFRGCQQETARTFHHEGYTNTCLDHVKLALPWMGDAASKELGAGEKSRGVDTPGAPVPGAWRRALIAWLAGAKAQSWLQGPGTVPAELGMTNAMRQSFTAGWVACETGEEPAAKPFSCTKCGKACEPSVSADDTTLLGCCPGSRVEDQWGVWMSVEDYERHLKAKKEPLDTAMLDHYRLQAEEAHAMDRDAMRALIAEVDRLRA